MRSYSILKYQRHKQMLYWTLAVSKHTKAGSKDSFPTSVSQHRDEEYSEIIDVRTPDEFSADHIPGSINIPVLSNQERIDIGTLYHSNSFEARKRGASLIGRNISEHLDKHFMCKSKDYSPLVYCWRGGQRSYSLAMILAQIGFQTCVLDGGYKTYRSHVCEELKTRPDQFCYRVISGMTGSGKTLILNVLHERGEQVLDLETLAKHKGSVLGVVA